MELKQEVEGHFNAELKKLCATLCFWKEDSRSPEKFFCILKKIICNQILNLLSTDLITVRLELLLFKKKRMKFFFSD